jgi:RimJ/RimL family protein N-acetyltransferase
MLKKIFPLYGEKVCLEIFSPENISEEYISWLNDKEVTQFSNQRFKNHTFITSVNYYNSFNGTDNIFLSIKKIDNKKMIGTMTMYFSTNHGVVDLGIMIGNKNMSGRGLGSDAWCGLVQTLSDRKIVRKITAGALRSNVPMIKLMNKSGMHLEATKRYHEIYQGRPEDILYFAKFCD